MYSISILGSFNAPGYAALQKGVCVKLVAEPTNAVDANAIAVYIGDKKAGYVANSANTQLPGCMSAKDLRPLLASKKVALTTALLVEEGFYSNSTGQQQKRFRANVYFTPARATKKKEPDKEAEYAVRGATVKHQRKVALQALQTEAVKKGQSPEFAITITREGDNGLFRYILREDGQEKTCGELVAPDKKDPIVKWFDNNSELKGVTTGKVIPDPDKDGHGMTEYYVRVKFVAEDKQAFLSEIDAAIQRGCGQEPELQEKLKFLSDSGVSKEVIKEFFAKIRPLVDTARIPAKPQRPYKSKTSNMNDILVASFMHKPIALIGDKGSGKNTLIETVCWLLNQPMVRVQGNVDMDKMDLTGSPSLIDGDTAFELSPVMTALQDGCTVIIDEANLVRAEVLGILHSATDTARSVLVPGYGEINLHPDAQVVYTLNEGYVGTSDMNEATIDRTVTFVLEPEVSLSDVLKGYPQDQVKTAQKVSDKIRKSVKDGTLGPEAITIRGYIDALDLAQFMPLKRALIRCVADKPQDTTMRKSIEAIINIEC